MYVTLEGPGGTLRSPARDIESTSCLAPDISKILRVDLGTERSASLWQHTFPLGKDYSILIKRRSSASGGGGSARTFEAQ